MTLSFEKAKQSLLSCLIGVISTIDLYNIKGSVIAYPSTFAEDFYSRSIDEHCKMNIYHNEWLM